MQSPVVYRVSHIQSKNTTKSEWKEFAKMMHIKLIQRTEVVQTSVETISNTFFEEKRKRNLTIAPSCDGYHRKWHVFSVNPHGTAAPYFSEVVDARGRKKEEAAALYL